MIKKETAAKKKIFMVEDELNNHQLYRDIFGTSGFEVVIRKSADGNFVNEVADYQPDIISMDLMIGKEDKVPERDGFEAIALLKTDPRTKAIPVIVLSNFFQDEKVQRAKELGAVDFLNIQGQTVSKIPEHYTRCVADPQNYRSSHPAFRTE